MGDVARPVQMIFNRIQQGYFLFEIRQGKFVEMLFPDVKSEVALRSAGKTIAVKSMPGGATILFKLENPAGLVEQLMSGFHDLPHCMMHAFRIVIQIHHQFFVTANRA